MKAPFSWHPNSKPKRKAGIQGKPYFSPHFKKREPFLTVIEKVGTLYPETQVARHCVGVNFCNQDFPRLEVRSTVLTSFCTGDLHDTPPSKRMQFPPDSFSKLFIPASSPIFFSILICKTERGGAESRETERGREIFLVQQNTAVHTSFL